MESVGSYEAKTHLPRLLERVAEGERITITRHGIPVAMLVPPSPEAKADPAEVIRQIKDFRRTNRLEGVTIRELIEEGRR